MWLYRSLCKHIFPLMVLFVNSFFAYEWIGDYPSSCAYYYCSCSTSTFNRPSSTNQHLFYSTVLSDCFDQFIKVIPSLSFKKTKVLSYIAVVCILSPLISLLCQVVSSPLSHYRSQCICCYTMTLVSLVNCGLFHYIIKYIM